MQNHLWTTKTCFTLTYFAAIRPSVIIIEGIIVVNVVNIQSDTVVIFLTFVPKFVAIRCSMMIIEGMIITNVDTFLNIENNFFRTFLPKFVAIRFAVMTIEGLSIPTLTLFSTLKIHNFFWDLCSKICGHQVCCDDN